MNERTWKTLDGAKLDPNQVYWWWDGDIDKPWIMYGPHNYFDTTPMKYYAPATSLTAPPLVIPGDFVPWPDFMDHPDKIENAISEADMGYWVEMGREEYNIARTAVNALEGRTLDEIVAERVKLVFEARDGHVTSISCMDPPDFETMNK